MRIGILESKSMHFNLGHDCERLPTQFDSKTRTVISKGEQRRMCRLTGRIQPIQ